MLSRLWRLVSVYLGRRIQVQLAGKSYTVIINPMEGVMMKTRLFFVIGLLSLALAGCSGMTTQEKCTVGGAVIGGVAGSVLTDSTLGTVGGAAVGGAVGHQVGKKGTCP